MPHASDLAQGVFCPEGAPVTLGEKIRAARLEQNLTQEQVAGPNFTRSYISELERGARTPRVTTLKVLARRLRRPLSYFLDGVPEEREPEALLAIGLAHLSAESIRAAQSPLERGLELATQQGEEVLQARLELALAVVDRRLGQTSQARRRIDRALRVFSRTGDPGFLARAQACLGWIKLDTGDAVSALWAFEAGLRLVSHRPQDAVLFADLHMSLGEAYRRLGQPEEARTAFQRALEAAEHFQDPHRVGGRHLHLSTAAAERGDFEEATEQAGRAHAVYSAIAHRRRLAAIHYRLGEADFMSDRWEEARQHYRWSIALHGAVADRHGVAHVLGSFVEAMVERVSPDSARTLAEVALELLSEGGDQCGRTHALRLRGTLCRLLGRTAESRDALEASLSLSEELHRPEEARLVRQELALLALDTLDLTEAHRQIKALHDAPQVSCVPAGV